MTQVILQPASGKHPTEHYRETIENSVPLVRIRPHISDELFASLQGLYPEGRALVWGAIPGEQNTPKWDRMQTGALVLFYKDKRFISSAQLTLKTRSSRLARELWRTLGRCRRNMGIGLLSQGPASGEHSVRRLTEDNRIRTPANAARPDRA